MILTSIIARQLVNELLIAAKSTLPSALEPLLGPIATGLGKYSYLPSTPFQTPSMPMALLFLPRIFAQSMTGLSALNYSVFPVSLKSTPSAVLNVKY